MMSSTSSLSFVVTLDYDCMVFSSISFKNPRLATTASIPKRSGFVASESFASTRNTLVNSVNLADEEHSCTSTCAGSVDLVAFALALRAADAEAAAREEPRDVFASFDSLASFDSVCTLDTEPSIAHMNAFELAPLVSVHAFLLAAEEYAHVDQQEPITSSGSFVSSSSIDTIPSEPSIARLTAFDLAIRARPNDVEAAAVEEDIAVAEPMSFLASLPSVDSAIGSIWSISEKPYPHISAAQTEARAARARIGEAWWTRPTQRRGRAPSWGTYTSRDIPSFETVSHLLPDAASLAFSAAGVPAAASSHAPVAPYVSGCRTHAQQLAYLYNSVHEAGVPVGSLLKLLSDNPEELFVPPTPPPAKASAAKRALRAFGNAVTHLVN
jgi:hypothetical protein